MFITKCCFIVVFIVVLVVLMSFMSKTGMINKNAITKEEAKNHKNNSNSIYQTKNLTHGNGKNHTKKKKKRK